MMHDLFGTQSTYILHGIMSSYVASVDLPVFSRFTL